MANWFPSNSMSPCFVAQAAAAVPVRRRTAVVIEVRSIVASYLSVGQVDTSTRYGFFCSMKF